ncbi:MAG TPA: hypothetical protein ENN03_10530 [bacterium]|nr:hypothetical protein [bacterium]
MKIPGIRKKRKWIHRFPKQPGRQAKSLLKQSVERIQAGLEKTISIWRNLSGVLRREIMLSGMRKGDIILASPPWYRLSPIAFWYRVLLRSRYVHSMLYLGDRTVLHTTIRRGVVIHRVPRKIARGDRYAILRLKSPYSVNTDRVAAYALTMQSHRVSIVSLIAVLIVRLSGSAQFRFKLARKSLRCSQLIDLAYDTEGTTLVPSRPRDTIISQDLMESPFLERIH